MQITADTDYSPTVKGVNVALDAKEAADLRDAMNGVRFTDTYYGLRGDQQDVLDSLTHRLDAALQPAEGIAGSALVVSALTSDKVRTEIIEGRKIQAIKELRAISGAGLKEAKDAVDFIAKYIVR